MYDTVISVVYTREQGLSKTGVCIYVRASIYWDIFVYIRV